MKSIVTAAAVALALGAAHPAFASTNTVSEFSNAYSDGLKEAGQRGLVPQRICYAEYCANTLSLPYSDGIVLLANIVTKDGVGFQEVCVTMNTDHANRGCKASDGRVWREHWDGSMWQTTNTVADHFDN